MTIICPNCSRVHLAKLSRLPQDTIVQCDCEAAYRITVTVLHEGIAVDQNLKRRQLAYTYDPAGERVAFPDTPVENSIKRCFHGKANIGNCTICRPS